MAARLYLTAALVTASLIGQAIFQDQLTFTASNKLTTISPTPLNPLINIIVSFENRNELIDQQVLEFEIQNRSFARIEDTRTVNVSQSLWTFFKGVNLSWLVLFLSLFSVIGFIGNLLVCLAIIFDPKLQNATNYYLFSLAAADLLVSVIVIPLAIIKNFYQTWILGTALCAFWIFSDVFLCTTSILLLCVISRERYVGIKDPLKNREKSKSKIKLIIYATLLVSLLLSSPILVLGYIDKNNILREGNCSLFNKHFIIYGSMISFVIPIIIMVVMYCLTVKRLRKVLKEFKARESGKCNHMHLPSLDKSGEKIKFKKLRQFGKSFKKSSAAPNASPINTPEKTEKKCLLTKANVMSSQLSPNAKSIQKLKGLDMVKQKVILNNEPSRVEVKPPTAHKKDDEVQIQEASDSRKLVKKDSNHISVSKSNLLHILTASMAATRSQTAQEPDNASSGKRSLRDILNGSIGSNSSFKRSASDCKNLHRNSSEPNQAVVNNSEKVPNSISLLSFRNASAKLLGKDLNEKSKPTAQASEEKNQGSEEPPKSEANDNENKPPPEAKRSVPHVLVRAPTNSNKFKAVVNKHRLVNRAILAFQTNRESTAVKNEQKAVKVLGIVFFTFLLAWAPFGILNITSAFCESCIYPQILNVLSWLGYISSVVNPLIYNAFNEKFRYAFKQLLKCQPSTLKKRSFNTKTKVITKLALEQKNSIHSSITMRSLRSSSRLNINESSQQQQEPTAEQAPANELSLTCQSTDTTLLQATPRPKKASVSNLLLTANESSPTVSNEFSQLLPPKRNNFLRIANGIKPDLIAV